MSFVLTLVVTTLKVRGHDRGAYCETRADVGAKVSVFFWVVSGGSAIVLSGIDSARSKSAYD